MATSSYAKSLLGSIPQEMKAAMFKVAEYVFDRNLEFGPIDPNAATYATTNFRGRYVRVTTSTTANQEFSVAHGLGRPPNVFWPVGNPRAVNAEVLGDLMVARAGDDTRLYFKSGLVGATGWLYVE